MCVLSYFDDNFCATIDLSSTSSCPLKPSPFQVPFNASKSSCSFLYKKFVCHNMPSQHSPLHPLSTPKGLSIIDTFKFTKYRKKSRSDITVVGFKNIFLHKVKYLPFSFNGDNLFVLFHVPFGVPSAYGRSMDGMDKMCNGHPWCTTKTMKIKNNFGLSFRQSTCAGHFQCHNDHCDYMHSNGGMRNNTKSRCSTHLSFVVGDVAPPRSIFECKVC